jgi:hypothetical protein
MASQYGHYLEAVAEEQVLSTQAMQMPALADRHAA